MKNSEYLVNQLFYTGFGNQLEEELKAKLAEQKPEFTLKYETLYGNEEATATLHFKKSNQSDLYFFNSYDLSLKKPNQENTLDHTFYVGKENNITLKEAYNLLSGRAINKEWTKIEKVGEGEEAKYVPSGEKYNAWMQLDFKNSDENGNFKTVRYHENYNFDLADALSKQPIKELANEKNKDQLINSLKKGNRQSVTIVRRDSSTQVFIEANPKDRTINLYDNNLKRVSTKQEVSESKKVDQKQEEKKTNNKKKSMSV